MIKKTNVISKDKVNDLRTILVGNESPKIIRIDQSDTSSFSSEESGYSPHFDKLRYFYYDIRKFETYKTKVRDKTKSEGNLSNYSS